MASQTPLTNVTFLFLPFRFLTDTEEAARGLMESSCWECPQLRFKYLFRYVEEKFNGTGGPDTRGCLHFELTGAGRKSAGLPEGDAGFGLPGGKGDVSLRLRQVSMDLFRTGVGLLCLEIIMENEEPREAANMLHYLKRAGLSRIVPLQADDEETGTGKRPGAVSVLELAEQILRSSGAPDARFFYHMTDKTRGRASVLTYLRMPDTKNREEEMFFLRYCYGRDFRYYKDEEKEKREIFRTSANYLWGVSAEAAVCLGDAASAAETGFLTRFTGNFCTEYRFVYAMAIHQKYMLYKMLTDIGMAEENDLEKLNRFQTELNTFLTDFVFTCITEVPQYQILYEKVCEAMHLEQLYSDVNEPLKVLEEQRTREEQKRDEQREENTNHALFLLALLGVFSALIDSNDYVKAWFEDGGTGMVIARLILLALCFGILWLCIRSDRRTMERIDRARSAKGLPGRLRALLGPNTEREKRDESEA